MSLTVHTITLYVLLILRVHFRSPTMRRIQLVYICGGPFFGLHVHVFSVLWTGTCTYVHVYACLISV